MTTSDYGCEDDEDHADTIVKCLKSEDLGEDAKGSQVRQRPRSGRAATSRHFGYT